MDQNFLSKTSIIILIVGVCLLELQCSSSKSTKEHKESETTESWNAGDVYKGKNGWIEARAGNMPLVISAPHGGTYKPDEIPERSGSDIVTVRDMNTIELALQVEQALLSSYDVQPFVVINHLHRSKLDMNRDIKEATSGNKEAETPWYNYHNYIESALEKAIDEFGFAIFIDLHGHGHDKQRLELGYALTKQEIKENYRHPEKTDELVSKSSLYNLLREKNQETGNKLKELFTGEMAFGTLMEDEGIEATPSKQDPYPLEKDSYFTGGYNTRRYTSTNYPKTFGWQIESNYDGLRESEGGREKFAQAFAKAINTYMMEHKNYKPN